LIIQPTVLRICNGFKYFECTGYPQFVNFLNRLGEKLNSAIISDIPTLLSISPDGEINSSSGTDNLVKTWDFKSGENLQIYKGHKNDVRGVAFAPDGKTVGSAGLDGTIKLWEIK